MNKDWRIPRSPRALEGLALAVMVLGASSVRAQPAIRPDDVDCLPRGEFTRLLADIDPASAIRAAKLYFRSSLYPEFYFVAMSPDEDGSFAAVLPIPAAETTKVVYYVEAVDLSFQTSRSEEREITVTDDSGCRRGPGGLFPGSNPAIVLGATKLGLPAIPAGFQATGITGFLAATGGATGVGGAGIGIAVGAAAGAAAGVGVIVAGGGPGTATTTAPRASGSLPMTTSSMGPTTTTTSSMDPTTTTAAAGSSTSSAPPTTTSSTTSAPDSTPTTTVPAAVTACFEWRALGNCQVFFDSCSTPEGSVARHEWRMLGPPVAPPPQVESFTFSFDADPRCRDNVRFNRPVRLTVFDGLGGSDSLQENVTVLPGLPYRTDERKDVHLSFSSSLTSPRPDGSARGRIVVNGAPSPPLADSSPVRYEISIAAGTARIELTLETKAFPGTLWALDFSSSAGLVPGTLNAEEGTIVAADDRRIVFRLNGDPGERLRLRLAVR